LGIDAVSSRSSSGLGFQRIDFAAGSEAPLALMTSVMLRIPGV
jgi:hypothetical protein